MSDLPLLENIIDDIVCHKEILDEEEKTDIFETVLHLIQEYMDENENAISDTDFQEELIEEIEDLLDDLVEEFPFDKKIDEIELEDIVSDAVEYYFEYISPARWSKELSTQDTSTQDTSNQDPHHKDLHTKIKNQIAYLETLPQPAQRTPEWYAYRHNLITASNAYKAFDTQSSKNQLIYEKCKPLADANSNASTWTNITSPMHWGQKYEPVSVMIYETRFNAKIQDFGCIQHREYSFLGASPDGINVDPNSPHYGRMLEIKNPTTRVITGEPKKEYWVQCQLQMETCDLYECDFLETKFAEYEGAEDFEKDGDFLVSAKNEMKGIMMYFADKTGTPKYIYKPLNMSEHTFAEWEQEMIELYEGEYNYTWIKNNYWRLQQISCVLVKRNVQWFQANIKSLEELWNTVLVERVTGAEHRAPKKKQETTPHQTNLITNYLSSTATTTTTTTGSGCLIKLFKNKETGAIQVIKKDSN
jgi:putative phage-type endonuclease